VQELIDRKLLSFKEESPNVKTNPLPGHASSSVNAVEEIEEFEVVKEVAKVKTPMSVIREKLIGFDLFEEMHSSCEICSTNPANCQKMKKCLQELMDQGLVQIGYSKGVADVAVLESQGLTPIEIPYQNKEVQIPVKRVDPMVFHVPTPFPFESTKKVPCNYLPIVSVGGKPITNIEPAIVNIVGLGGITRSGRIFFSDQTSKSTAGLAVEPVKGKSIEDVGVGVGS
jgi:hypothetical protein